AGCGWDPGGNDGVSAVPRYRRGDDQSCPQSSMTILAEGFPPDEPSASIVSTTSAPSVTAPKTTCLPSSHEVTTVVMKNCEPLVFGPALAIDRRNGRSCLSWKFSSANFAP